MSQLVTYNGVVGYVLEERRLALGKDQAALSKITGISQPVLSRLEKGKASITIDQLFVLCQALEIKPSELIIEAEEKVDGFNEFDAVDVKTTKEVGTGTALLTGAAIGAVLGVLLSKK